MTIHFQAISRAATRREVTHMRGRLTVLIATLVFGTAACNSLLDVSIPGRVPVDELNNPLLATTLVNSALGEFECAYAQYVVTTGILTGEYIISGLTIGSNIWGWRGEVEIRGTAGNCGGGYGYYTALQRARFLAEDARKRIESFDVANKPLMLAQVTTYGAYATLLLGEGFCEMAIDEGPIMTRAQVFARAEQHFTDAIGFATTAGDASLLQMAYVGRARARLSLGNGAGAAADADQIQSNFVRNANYSTVITRRQNRVFDASITSRDISVALAYRGLTVDGSADSRVVVVDANRNGQDGVTRQWDQRKYLTAASAIPIASYDEAQLIIAEVRGGTEGFDAINRLRTRAALPLLAPGTVVDQALVLEERRRELFSEGHRYNDMLRTGIPFPTGLNHKNQTYGNITCLPLPDVEVLNNPNI